MSKNNWAPLLVIAGIVALAYLLLKDKLITGSSGSSNTGSVPTVPIASFVPIVQLPTITSLVTPVGQPVPKPGIQEYVAVSPRTGATVGVTQTTKYFKVNPSNLPATKKAFENTLLKLAPLNIKKMPFPVFRK